MSRLSRNKGAHGELWARDLMRLVAGQYECERRVSGDESRGVTGRDLQDTPGYCVQVKNTGVPQPMKAIAEACRAAKEGEIATAFCRQSSLGRSTPFRVVLAAEDALFLFDLDRRMAELYPKRHAELKAEMAARCAELRTRHPHAI